MYEFYKLRKTNPEIDFNVIWSKLPQVQQQDSLNNISKDVVHTQQYTEKSIKKSAPQIVTSDTNQKL